MKRVRLKDIAHARSGDKGDSANVGLLANNSEIYEILRKEVTSERVKKHFAGLALGEVERFEMPNLLCLNFILHNSLGGGGSETLRNDAQGKTYGQAILLMEIDIPEKIET